MIDEVANQGTKGIELLTKLVQLTQKTKKELATNPEWGSNSFFYIGLSLFQPQTTLNEVRFKVWTIIETSFDHDGGSGASGEHSGSIDGIRAQRRYDGLMLPNTRQIQPFHSNMVIIGTRRLIKNVGIIFSSNNFRKSNMSR